MKHYLFAFFAFVFIISCGPPEFEKNTRILVKGKLIDENDNPIPNAEILVNTERLSSFLWFGPNDIEFLLGHNFSKSDGSFKVVSLFDRNEEFNVLIDGGIDFSNYLYKINTENYTPPNFTFDLGTVISRRYAKLTCTIKRVSTLGTTFRFSLRLLNPNCVEFYVEDNLDEERTNLSKYYERTFILDDDSPDFSRNFTSQLGTDIEFTYSINNQPEITQIFTIDDENFEFNFSY